MKYENIVKGKFNSRPNRFIADVTINGRDTRAHVKNTGRCRELLIPGAEIYLEDFEGRMGSRKMRYSLITVSKDGVLVNMDSQAPNKIAAEAIADGTITLPEFGPVSSIRPEKKYGNSRFDLYIENEKGQKGFIEVKGCTLETEGLARFPDAPTERGLKHVTELIQAHKDGYFTAVLFIIQMKGIHTFSPNYDTQPAFGEMLKKAEKEGVHILAYDCIVTAETVTADLPVPVLL